MIRLSSCFENALQSEIGNGMGFLARFRDPCGCLVGLWARR
jgi:hypothetical protein